MHSEEFLLEEVARLESKLKTVRRKGNLVLESQICNRLGKNYEMLGEWREALTFHYFDSEIAAAMDDFEGQLVALNNLALVFKRLSIMHRAKEIYKRMLNLADKAPKFALKKCLGGVVDACIGLGNLYLERTVGKPKLITDELCQKAFQYYERASVAAKKYQGLIDEGLIADNDVNRTASLEMEAKAATGMGKFYGSASIGRIQDSVNFFDRAIFKLEDMKDDEGTKYWLKFLVLGEKGAALGCGGDWGKAIESCYDEQLGIAKEYLDDDRVADAQFNLAYACYKLGDFSLAKSTILNCMDTVKVRCTDQTKAGPAEALLKQIFEACEREEELGRLEAVLESSRDGESKFDYLFQVSKTMQKLQMFPAAYEAAKRLLPPLERGSFDKTVKRKVYQLLTELAGNLKIWSDAMFYGRKWLECVDGDGDDEEGEEECLMCLLDAHVNGGSIDAGVLAHAIKCRQMNKDNGKELVLLSHLTLIHESLGNCVEASTLRSECLSLALAMEKSAEDHLAKEYTTVIEGSSYFGDRKISRTSKSLMGGDFQMCTRTSKAGAIAKRRVKSSKPAAENGTMVRRKKKTANVIHENLESASDLDDFIASAESSETESVPEDRRKAKIAKKIDKKARTMVFISSSEPDAPDLDQPNEVIQNDRIFAEDLNEGFMYDAPYKQLALRIKVQIGDHTLIVPCFDDDITERKRVSWLLSEAAKRYAEIDAKEPIIRGLSYAGSSAWLSLNDPISLVLTDGQTVRAHVDGWRRRGWMQELQYQLHRIGAKGVEEIEQIFSSVQPDGLVDCSHVQFNLIGELEIDAFIGTLLAKQEEGGLAISFCAANCPPLSKLAAALPENSVKHLDLSYACVQDKSDILSLVGRNIGSLRELNLSYLEQADGLLAPLLHLLCYKGGLDSPLTTLHMAGHEYESEDGLNFEPLHFLPSLGHLNLSASSLTDNHIRQMAGFLEKSSSIAHIAVRLENTIQSGIFLEGVRSSHSLRSLDLLDTPRALVDGFSTQDKIALSSAWL